MDKLAEIIAWKRQEIAPRTRPVSDAELSAAARPGAGRQSFRDALCRSDGLAVIAEIKRRSPSAGAIAEGRPAPEQALVYASGGADAISVLTDQRFFGGRIEDLRGAVDALAQAGYPTPCLRKDFTVHRIQILEAAEAGASAILLIARALSDAEMTDLYAAATLAGLDALFEVHDAPELDRVLRLRPKIVGVNNRDLGAFKTDLTISEQLIPQIPAGVVAVSESGIFTAADAARARAAGARAILVGESLMRAPDPAGLLAAFRHA
jgi:indole-3-glycerol phosphate synthase